MTTTAKRTGLLGAGIVVLIVGLLAALGLWISSTQRESDAVRNLARAPIGCDTMLDFEASGEFYIYIESAGRFDGAVSGDCGAEGEYDLPSDSLPPVTLSMTAPNGDDVALDSDAGVSYDTAGYVGQSVRVFTVNEPGGYQLRVEAPGSTEVAFAAAVGRDPSEGVGSMRLGAVLTAIGALIIGGLLLLLSRRSATTEPEVGDVAWPGQPMGAATSPPGMAMPPQSGVPAPLGPPTQYPIAPPASAPPTPQGGSWTPQAQTTPQQDPSRAPGAPTWGATPNDGSSGVGQRSPWAPPSDSAQ